MPTDINDIIQYLSPIISTIYRWLPVLRIVFLAISVFLFGFIIFALLNTTWLNKLYLWDAKEFLTKQPYTVKKLFKQWQKIKVRLETGMETEYKLAVIEADSLTDDILKRMGFFGETLGERLEKVTTAILPDIAELAEAHKIRNNIVRDPDYRLSADETKKVIGSYEKALVELQAL
ncbi:MAG: hypothetical protein V1756_02580 [Patescibacteria group bacterium]